MTDTKFKPIQTNKVLIFVELFLNYFPVALVFLVPIFFLTTSTEFFEFNKAVLFTVGTILLTIFWILKLLLRSKVHITKSAIDLPIWIYLVVFALSSFLSINPTDSIFGNQIKWVPSLLSVVTLVLYFYILSTNLRSLQAIKYSIYALIAGGTISSIVALLSFYGIKLSSQPFAQIPNFTLAGSLEVASIVAAMALLFAISVYYNTKTVLNKGLCLVAIIVNILVLGAISYIPSVLIAVLGFTYLTLSHVRNFKTIRVEFSTIAVLAIVWGLLLTIPLTSKIVRTNNFSLESNLSLEESWGITATAIKDKPIYGFGPNTWSVIFNQNKPININSQAYGDFSNVKPFSQAFEDLASLGLLGGLAGIFFAFKMYEIVSQLTKKKEEFTPVHQALLIPIVGIPLYHLIGNGSTQTNFMFVTYLGIFISLVAGYGKNKTSEDIYISVKSFNSLDVADEPERKEKFQYFAIIPLLGIAGAIGYYSSFNIQAEYFFRKAIDSALSNDIYGVYNNQINARNAFPRRDIYHSAIAQTNINLAVTLSNKQQLSDQEKEAVQTLISEAIRSTRIATETLNPFSYENWLVRSSIYRTLIGVTSDADQWTIGALNNAIQLNPVNPNLRMELGTIYFSKGDYLSAANFFKQATQLKPSYANAHYNLAQALIKLESFDVAIQELEITKSLLSEKSPDYDRLNKEIEDARNKKPQVAGSQTTRKTSVQELENKTTEVKVAEGPLTKPSDNAGTNNLEKAVNPDTANSESQKQISNQ